MNGRNPVQRAEQAVGIIGGLNMVTLSERRATIMHRFVFVFDF
ncbi:hypothetical protein [Paenibacillus etheri]|nr:hypothetical protein [Paenibacillus etheri]